MSAPLDRCAAEVRPAPSRAKRVRRTIGIDLPQARNLIGAAAFAAHIGRPLNRFTTVHWEAGQVTDIGPAIQRFRKLVSDYMAVRKMGPLVDVWVREAGAAEGEHWHWLLHLPPGRRLGHCQPGWLRLCGVPRNRARGYGVIFSKPVGRTLSHALSGQGYGEAYADHIATVIAYMLKGCLPQLQAALELPSVEQTGLIPGKRCGTSENIGKAGRQRSNFTAPRTLPELLLSVMASTNTVYGPNVRPLARNPFLKHLHAGCNFR